jgi:hypothetical protein
MKKLPKGFDGKVSERGSVFFGEGFDEFECLINTNGEPESNDAFGRWRPTGEHDFFSDGEVFGSREKLANSNVRANYKEKVENKNLLSEECIKGASSVECDFKQMH